MSTLDATSESGKAQADSRKGAELAKDLLRQRLSA